jgi:hypothetical protein
VNPSQSAIVQEGCSLSRSGSRFSGGYFHFSLQPVFQVGRVHLEFVGAKRSTPGSMGENRANIFTGLRGLDGPSVAEHTGLAGNRANGQSHVHPGDTRPVVTRRQDGHGPFREGNSNGEVKPMMALPCESDVANPFWLTYIIRGLLEVHMPVEPAKIGIDKRKGSAVIRVVPVLKLAQSWIQARLRR